ncbi:hypothetical protein JZ751_015486, partial [Albula glossodonta]
MRCDGAEGTVAAFVGMKSFSNTINKEDADFYRHDACTHLKNGNNAIVPVLFLKSTSNDVRGSGRLIVRGARESGRYARWLASADGKRGSSTELSHSGDSLKMILTRNPYLKPLPLFLKPHKLSPERDTFIRGNTKFSSQYPLGLDRFYSPSEHGSQKRKRMPFKMSSQDTESSDEGEDWSPKAEALSHPLYQNATSGLAFQRDTDMIDLSRIHLYRTLGGFNSTQVKREPNSPEPLWSPSPVLMPPPPAYFPPLHPNWVPLPFLMRGPVIPLSPHGFYQKESLLRHRRATSRAGGDPPAAAKHGLTVHVDDSYHVDVGGDQKRWKCRMCEKSYTSKYNLGTRPHKCQVCHKAFTQTSHLKRHMMQHSDVKPYSCGVCGRGFAYPSELRAHELKHEKGQENVCVECGLDFPTLAQLKRHLNTHRGPTVYSCSDCEKTLSSTQPAAESHDEAQG